MKFTVTQDDINYGHRGKCQSCPVALSLARLNPGVPIVVTGWLITVGEVTYVAPDSLTDFIHDFDQGLPVRPRKFNLAAK